MERDVKFALIVDHCEGHGQIFLKGMDNVGAQSYSVLL